jgi:hypothetical protein
MASRQEEKEARRKARMEAEAAERKAEARRKRLQLVLGGIIAIGALAAIVVVVFAGGGSDKPGEGGVRAADAGDVTLPAQEATDVDAAAKAAGCDLIHPKDEGRGHEERSFKASDYKTNPPQSGTHFPLAAQDGIYDPGDEPDLGTLVHALEHGRIDVQYAPGTSATVRKQLEAFVAENGGYHTLMYQNQTKMPYAVAATAWDHILGCKSVSDKTWDAFRTFRDRYIDKGPEPAA